MTWLSPRWKIQLVGQDEELRALAKMFPGGAAWAPRVWFEGKTCYLHAPELDPMPDVEAVLARGEVLVGRLNGLAFLKFGVFRPVDTGNIMQAASQGGHNVFLMAGTAVMYVPTRDLLAYLDHTPNRPPAMNATVEPMIADLPPVEHWQVPERFAPAVDEALGLLPVAMRSQDWRLLHFIYEIIEGHFDPPQPSKVAKVLKWSSAEEIVRFSATANDKSVLGTKARHGRQTRPAPPNPMTFQEARGLVQGLLLAWVRYLATREQAKDQVDGK